MKKKISISYLYLLLPFFLFFMIDYAKSVDDMWFLFSHGKYILSNGFPHFEFLTIHDNFHFVMQQWGFSVLLYFFYYTLNDIGVLLLVFIFSLLIIVFLYKFCMVISSNNKYASCLVASIIVLLLELCHFIIPRPQLVSLLLLIITLYILERFSKDKNDKFIFFLPLISLLFINCHASLWLMMFIFSLPYIVEFLYSYIRDKDLRVFKLLLVLLLAFLVGFINPYGSEAMFYSLSSYGIPLINKLIREMHSISFSFSDYFLSCYSILIVVVAITYVVVWFFNKEKYSKHSYFLFFGCLLLACLNLRNISLLLIGGMPFIINGINKDMKSVISIKYFLVIIGIIILLVSFQFSNNFYKVSNNSLDKIVKIMDNKKSGNRVYTSFRDGAYIEYNGYKTYIDSRAEVFLKKNNKSKDILYEYYNILIGKIDYSLFLKKYNFDYLIVNKNTYFYYYLKKQNNYKLIYSDNNRCLFSK